ncbi:hypothetical protein [Longimicrobium sp.]|uniref:hypothetical protein n=1 Tax=Longimicrobium sp. TaxID=2029185 RepID=UPI002C3654C0|nr:hypothetical protein [Longimicrobium sp.]HSU12552.1 hypothetical protein [Longimicrobium sp.]
MKSMIRFPRMLAAGAAVATALVLHTPASAQYQQGQQGGQRWEQGQRQDPGQRLDRQVSMLTQRLRLSSTQASQIRRILQQQDEQFQAWRQSHRGEFQRGGREQGSRQQGGWQQQQGQRGQRDGQRQRRELPAELQAIRTRSEQQIERVLNDSQRAEYRRLQDERGQFANGQRGEGRGQRNGREQGRYDGSR